MSDEKNEITWTFVSDARLDLYGAIALEFMRARLTGSGHITTEMGATERAREAILLTRAFLKELDNEEGR